MKQTLKLKDSGSFFNLLYSNNQTTPVVGAGATILHYSDREVVEVTQESEFFEFKCYIKGTVHFKVKDMDILNEFNRRACAAKGFMLPDEELFKGKSRRSQKVK